MAKKFSAGLLTGILTTVGAVAAGALTYKKRIIDPDIDEENRIEENRIKATRKSHSAHQG